MASRHGSTHSQNEISLLAARAALLSTGLFLVLLLAVHILKPELDPSWRFISEYAIGDYGWVMRAAFLALAVSNVALFVAIRKCMETGWGKLGSILFLVGAIGLLLAGIFVTDPVNTAIEARTTSGSLHNLGGALGLGGFLGTLIFSARLLRHESWRSARKAVGVATAVVVLGFLIAFVTITVIAVRQDGVFGPDTSVGWPNRIGIVSGCAWLLIISWHAARTDCKKATSSASLGSTSVQ